MIKLQLGIFLGFFILLAGCTPQITQKQIETGQKEADEAMLTVEEWYDRLAYGEFEAAANLFDKQALSEVTPEAVVRVLRNFDVQHGPVEEYALQKWNFQLKQWELGESVEGQVVELTFDVSRQKRPTEEYFKLVKRPGSSSYGILYYEVTHTK